MVALSEVDAEPGLRTDPGGPTRLSPGPFGGNVGRLPYARRFSRRGAEPAEPSPCKSTGSAGSAPLREKRRALVRPPRANWHGNPRDSPRPGLPLARGVYSIHGSRDMLDHPTRRPHVMN